MKKLFILPMIGLILGTVAIATEIKTTDVVRTGQQLSGVIISCIQGAIEKRETAVLSALTAYQTSGLVLLTNKKSALVAAWNESTKSKITTAVNTAWKIYTSSMKVLKDNLRISRNTAWSTYKKEVKSCKGYSFLQTIDTTSVNNEQ